MDTAIYERVKQNPQFDQLVSRRTRLAWTLSAIIFGAYFCFIFTIAFFPQILGLHFCSSVITLGIPVGVGIIILAFVLTGIYVMRANGEFDNLTAQIKAQVEDEL